MDLEFPSWMVQFGTCLSSPRGRTKTSSPTTEFFGDGGFKAMPNEKVLFGGWSCFEGLEPFAVFLPGSLRKWDREPFFAPGRPDPRAGGAALCNSPTTGAKPG